MPGLIGFTGKQHRYDRTMLLNMRTLLKHFDFYVEDELYSDKHIYASRTHLGIINQGIQPYILNNQIYVWLEGEFYNQEELRAKYNVKSRTDNELIVNIYNSTKSFDFLKDIDGYYVSVLYNKEQNRVYLISDRFGYKTLYWGIVDGNLVWSSELKGFLAHKDFKQTIDLEAVKEFFGTGHLLEDCTWFKDIELVPPASVIAFDIKDSKIKHHHYWSWSDIKLVTIADERELAKEIGQLLKEAVHKRVKYKERIGISLSGGLDSRAILAAVPNEYQNLHTFTFGCENCDDIKIAAKVSKIRGAKHHIFNLNKDNWLMPRINGVWRTDGNLNLLHMHGVEFHDNYKGFMDINLNGFAGDLIIGGSFLNSKYVNKKINAEIVDNLKKYKIKIENFREWYMIDKIDPYFLCNHVRRFTNSGSILIASVLEQRKPFLDNKLMELVYGISDTLKNESYIYNKMLLKTFPEYYKNIPWQKTGCPITYPNNILRLIKFKNRVVNKLKRESQRLGFNFKDLRGYTDYPAWIRQEPARSFFERLLLDGEALYPEYIDKDKIQSYVKDHMVEKADYHNELCLALTFELWLQQVFGGKFRA